MPAPRPHPHLTCQNIPTSQEVEVRRVEQEVEVATAPTAGGLAWDCHTHHAG